MDENDKQSVHTADDAALGFYYQTFYALLTLLQQTSDEAAVCVEGLDDVELVTNGESLLFQLKHSKLHSPVPITIKSKSLWRTLKVWIDVIPQADLSTTSFHLVSVAQISSDSPLAILKTTLGSVDKAPLVNALIEEAERVSADRKLAGEQGKKSLPHEDRFAGCEAFLELTSTMRENLVGRITIQSGAPNIAGIESQVCDQLNILPKVQREAVAKRLIGWWDREVVYSLCGKRDRLICFEEIQKAILEFASDLFQEKLLPDFESAVPPTEYQPDGMLTKQIQLVSGFSSDISKAIREEWRAREQRSTWVNASPAMASKIDKYDQVLEEHWRDIHDLAVEECAEKSDDEKSQKGLEILRWSHDKAPALVQPFSDGWNAPYYVRGSYQVLSIGLKVGWHPDFREKLGGKK